MKSAWLAILLALSAHPALASAPGMLILPFDNATAQPELDDLRDGIPELLTACLSAYPDRVAVVDRWSLESLVGELSLGREPYLAEESFARIGALTPARYVLRGSLTLRDGELHIQALVFDVASTRLRFSGQAQGPLAEIPGWLCESLPAELAAALAEETVAGATLADAERPEVQNLLIEGLGHYYNGDYAKALPAFIKLLRSEPNDPDAHYWLGKGFYAAGLEALAAVQLREFAERFPEHSRTRQAEELLATIATE